MSTSNSFMDTINGIAGKFSIKLKLYGVAGLTAVLLCLVLLITNNSFSSLQSGFEDVLEKTNIGMSNAKTTESDINKVDRNLTKMSSEMVQLVSDLQRTNQNVRILERKIKGFAAQQIEIMETLEVVAENMEESDELYEIEDLTDTVTDIEATIRREGLVGLANTVNEMNAFGALMEEKVKLLNELSLELKEGSTLASQMVSGNTEISVQVTGFGEDISDSSQVIIILLIGVIIVVVLLILVISATIIGPLIKAIMVAENISKGDLSAKITVNSKDEIGKLMSSMSQMQGTLSDVIEKDVQNLVNAAKNGDLSHRIISSDKQGCFRELSEGVNELVSTSGSIVNDTSRVIGALAQGDLSQTIDKHYRGEFQTLQNNANATIAKLKTVIEGDIQSLVNKAEQGDLSNRINLSDKSGFYSSLSNGINSLVDKSESIINETVTLLGAMSHGDLTVRIEKDYKGSFNKLKSDAHDTQQKLTTVIEGDIQNIVNAARHGDLSQRIITDGKEGFFLTLSQGINDLVDVSDKIVKDTGRVLGALASGDLSQSIDTEYQGAFNSLKQDANATVIKLDQVIEQDIQKIVDQARRGNLSQRISVQDKEGFYEGLSRGINDIVTTSDMVVHDTVNVFGALAKGDLSQKIEREYEGDFAKLQSDANATVSKLKLVIEGDIQHIVNAANRGDLSNRIQLNDKDGFFETLSLGINQLVDVSSKIINEAATVAKALADGNLSKSINGEYQGLFDQLKQNINQSVSNMRDIVGEIRFTANNVSNGSSEIASGNNDLSDRTQQQAASLEQTNATMRELMDRVTTTTTASAESAKLAQGSRDIATQGGQVVANAVLAMSEIDQSSRKISDIIGVIDEIAFQTNLLALNAAVEAARAGESGRGFTVVAGEVRNLAQRSAQAAKEIKNLIIESGNKVDEGSTLVNNAGETLNEIVEAVTNVTESIKGISLDAQEQKVSIQQIFQTIAEMDDNTQQNAGLVEEISTASVSLNEQSDHLSELVSSFQTETDENIEETPNVTSSKESYEQASRPSLKKISKPKPSVSPAPMKKTSDQKILINDEDDWEVM